MKKHALTAVIAVVMSAASPGVVAYASAADLQPRTVQAWNTYVAATEARINSELASPSGFLMTDFAADAKVTREAIAKGTIPVGPIRTVDPSGKAIAVPGGLIAHWRGAVFLPGVTLETLLDRLQHPNEHGPHQQDVLRLRVLDREPDQIKLAIRMRQSKIVTVTYDTEHVVNYRRHGKTRASSTSVSTRIAELDNAGAASERALPEGQDRGFLWRMNSYWRYEQVDGGMIVELESLTLSRGIPLGFGVVVEPLVDRVARESINRTLSHVRRTYGTSDGVRTSSGQ